MMRNEVPDNVSKAKEEARALVAGQHASIRYRTERNIVRATGTVESVRECGVALWVEPVGRWTPIPFKDILKVEAGRLEQCSCPKACDCQSPQAGLMSNHCPIHTLNPYPYPECPVHGGQWGER